MVDANTVDTGVNPDSSLPTSPIDLEAASDLDLEALAAMNSGDFAPISTLLRSGSRIHSEVRARLAEFLTDGNDVGRLELVRQSRARVSDGACFNRIFETYSAVTNALISNPELGVEDALHLIASGVPARSYSAVRADYYVWGKVLERSSSDRT